MGWMNEATDAHIALRNQSIRDGVPMHESPGGYFRRLDGWKLDEYTALRRTLTKCGFWGEVRDDAIRKLYVDGLNLPLKFQEDLDLLVKLTGNDKIRDVFDEQLRNILCGV